jgi:glycosyltransferase involved in cell wall biosynthesis/tetratricopeptide (TPR) repeat protein
MVMTQSTFASPEVFSAKAKAQLHLARAWHLKRNLERAIDGYRAVINLEPQAIQPYHLLGSLLLTEKRLEEAQEVYIQAIRINPNFALFHKQLTDILIERQGLEAPFEYYGLALISQPPQISPGDILCCLVVRNEAMRLPYLLSYYRQKGIDQFLIVDNASTDKTQEYLLAQSDVALWQGNRPFNTVNFGSAWFELLLRKYGINHWCLTIDADEILYYPSCETRSIRELCADLDRQYKRVFTTILLDMYSDQPIQATHYEPGQNFLDVCPYFDRQFFHQETIATDGEFPGQKRYVGGMRERVFGAKGDYYLNKAPLLKYQPDIVLTGGQHFVGIADDQIAEETGALLHFKYFSSFQDYVSKEVERKQHHLGAFQYQEYAAKLNQTASLTLFDPRQSLKLHDSQQLVDLGVMKTSPLPSLGPWLGSKQAQPHILFYSDCYGVYGVTQWSHALMLAMRDRGYQVSSAQREVRGYLTESQAAAGIFHHWLQPEYIYTGTTYPRCFYDWAEPYQLFVTTSPDLIVFANGGPASDLTAAEVAKDLGIPYLTVVHCATPDLVRQFSPHLDRLPPLYEQAAAVVTVCQDNLNLMHQFFGLKAQLGQVIYNGRPQSYFRDRDLDRRSQLRQDWGIPEDGILCFTTARLDICKGFQYQVMAMQQLRQDEIFPKLYFVWAGTGHMGDRLQKMVSDLNLNDHVRFLGERSDVPDLLDAADIFVLPSQFEGMPLAIMEAMAKGVPVIASAVSGIPEELGDTGALLPDPKINSQATIDTLANTLRSWASQPELLRKRGRACRERAIELFHEDRMLAQYFSLIEATLAQQYPNFKK